MIRRCIPALLVVAVTTLLTTFSYLVVPLYMMLVYRVVASGSFGTLFALGALTLFALLIASALDYARRRVLRRVAVGFALKIVVEGMRVAIRLNPGGRRIIQKNKN